MARSRAAATASASRLPSPVAAARVSAASARSTAAESRAWRSAASRATCASRTAPASTRRTSIAGLASRAYLLTPTTVSRPVSMRAWRRAAASSMRRFGRPCSMARTMPPSASTSWMWAHARVISSCGQTFEVVAARPRIDQPRDAAFLLQDPLRVTGDARRRLARQRHRLVEGVGVQRLHVAEDGGQRLEGGARHVVERLLRGEAPAGGLRVRAQQHRLRAGRREGVHQPGPQRAAGAQLGDLHRVRHADAPEKAETRREGVDVEAGGEAGADVFDPIGQGVGQLEVGRGSGLLHVVAAHRDRVEARHVRRAVADDVRHDAHRRRRRIDVGVADHELLEDVVLDRAGEGGGRDALLLRGHDVERHHREHRPVHGHRHGHPIERDAVEQHLHVLDRIDGHAGHADVAGDARMIRVVAAMGRQIEGDRQPGLPRRQVAAVEGVRLLRRREAGVLPDRPRLPQVHRRVRPAQERRHPGRIVEVLDALEVRGRIAIA